MEGDVEVAPVADGPEEGLGGAAPGPSPDRSLHHHEPSLELSIDVPVKVEKLFTHFRIESFTLV